MLQSRWLTSHWCGVSDEYHLILEYSTGDTWGEHVADRANRFIVSNDKSNGELLGVEGLHSRVRESGFQPDVFVLAGACCCAVRA